MMRKYLGIAVLALLVMALGAAYADPIPGSINELDNWNFEKTDGSGAHVWGLWGHGADMGIGLDGANGWAAYCKQAGGDLWIRQIVDETQNPLWNDLFHQKEIDLMADIGISWMGGGTGHPEMDVDGHTTSRVMFRLDWWNEGDPFPGEVIGLDSPPAPYHAESGWYYFDSSASDQWTTVNPWDDDIWVLSANGKPIQPRWVSVEIILKQAPGENVWVDNVNLTSSCIPEPMSIILGCFGLSSVAGLRRLIRR